VDTSASDVDRRWMRRALVLARRQAGATWPNPTVGCCMVKDGRLLAEAVHAGPGQPHAEASVLLALAANRIDPAGSTAYVSLEPCHHRGRTAPCTRALADAGIRRVVYATLDDTPRHAGGGAEWLRQQGMEVTGGVCEQLARELNHPFFETAADDEAHVTLKLALSVDGGLARRRGRLVEAAEREVTGERVRRRVHRMRSAAGAVVVGAGTARADHPRLDVRGLPSASWSGRSPRPVVVAGHGNLDPDAVPDGALLVCPEGLARVPRDVEVARVPASAGGYPAWSGVLDALVTRGHGIVLVEGGARLATRLLAESPPHRIHLYLAARGFGPEGVRLGAGLRLDEFYATMRVRRIGPDLEWVLRRRDLD
jgi:diaminohydroxyphosphoribosylaminopyrimidine deaminase/5-amino-6-(5-phosphoribosylamino)uracil reductase